MTLLELAEACERADGADRDLDIAIKAAVGHPWDYAADWESHGITARPYTASLDAAMSLVPEGLGFYLNRYWLREGEAWSCTISSGGLPDKPAQHFECFDTKQAPLAICAAAIRARHAMTMEEK